MPLAFPITGTLCMPFGYAENTSGKHSSRENMASRLPVQKSLKGLLSHWFLETGALDSLSCIYPLGKCPGVKGNSLRVKTISSEIVITQLTSPRSVIKPFSGTEENSLFNSAPFPAEWHSAPPGLRQRWRGFLGSEVNDRNLCRRQIQ